jgi:CubicO group peptidase (beta-lactamase class C family)
MKTFRLFALPMLLLTQLSVSAQNSTKEKITQVENGLFGNTQIEGEAPWTIRERMAYYKVPGLSIAVIQNYRVVWAKGYGFANDSSKTPVTTQTLFQAGSISKSLNAVGILKLVQDKKLDLYADINTYLTDWKFPYDSLSKGKKITMANLLSHSAGLNLQGFGGYLSGKPLPTIVQVLNGEKPANSPRVHSLFEPGLRFQYSGGGTIISQLMVADITHRNYAEYMKKEVLKPLGMASSTFAQPPVDVNPALLANAYNMAGNPLPGKFHVYPEQAAAGLWTNPTDLAKYVIEIQLAYAGKPTKVLKQATAKLMLTPYLGNFAGLGVFINKQDGIAYFSHPGVDAGFHSNYTASVEGGNGVIVMVNGDNDQLLAEVTNSVAKVYDFKGIFKINVKKVIVLPADVLQTYTGEFELAPQRTLTVFTEDGHLYIRATGESKRELYAQSQTRFFLKDLPYELEFLPDTTGKVKLVLYADEGKHDLKRIK